MFLIYCFNKAHNPPKTKRKKRKTENDSTCNEIKIIVSIITKNYNENNKNKLKGIYFDNVIPILLLAYLLV